MDEFETELTVEVVAQDDRLTALYELLMCGDTEAGFAVLLSLVKAGIEPPSVEHVIKRDYNLSDDLYRWALGKCIAGIAGVQVGREFFNSG